MSSVLIVQNESLREFEAQPGENLLEFLRSKGYSLSAPCGGNGKCGKCRVELSFNGKSESVFACKASIPGNCRITLPDRALGGIISADAPEELLPVSGGNSGLGAAVDLGTTTVAVRLFELSTGRSLGTLGEWNRQAAYGADVISRTQYTMEHPQGLQRLCAIVREQVFSMIRTLCRESGYGFEQLRRVYVAGNTIMQHIFAGLAPASLAVSPFRALSLFDDDRALVIEGVEVYLAPCVAAYVGGDICAGLFSAGLEKKHGLALFLDVGTNGEMALGGRDGFLCCAVASGPAFEGAGISCGMASTEGAVSHISWDGSSFVLQVIGGGKPKGLCGSALLDLLAILVKEGLVDEGGLLLPPDEAPEGFEEWLDEDENGNGLLFLSDDDSVYFTAADVRQLQLAKAAVAAGISVLLQKSGADFDEIEQLYLAGGFGSHMSAQSAVDIGMLPRALLHKAVCVGNASLAGAQAALLREESRRDILETRKKCDYLELSGNDIFNTVFPEHMSFDEEELKWN